MRACAVQATSFVDHRLLGIVMSAVSDYDTDLFAPHLTGNVPASDMFEQVMRCVHAAL